jgi:hypothetical protein
VAGLEGCRDSARRLADQDELALDGVPRHLVGREGVRSQTPDEAGDAALPRACPTDRRGPSPQAAQAA